MRRISGRRSALAPCQTDRISFRDDSSGGYRAAILRHHQCYKLCCLAVVSFGGQEGNVNATVAASRHTGPDNRQWTEDIENIRKSCEKVRHHALLWLLKGRPTCTQA